MNWEAKAFIGNKTVKEMLTHDIDLKSEKLKLSKFHSEYDLTFLPEDLKQNPHLTFYDYASHPGRIQEIPHSIIEDDLPKIKARHFSIVNDPFSSTLSSDHDKGRLFKLCFTVLKYKSSQGLESEGLCTSFLRSLLVKEDFTKKFRVQFS